jgi:hypothetical protein
MGRWAKIGIGVALGATLLFGFNSVAGVNGTTSAPPTTFTYAGTPAVAGKVVRAYIRRGFGPAGYDWLFMDVQTGGRVVSVGIAPTFVLSNLPIKEGDIVEVWGITPPPWPDNTLRAWEIYDKTQKRDYPVAGPGAGWRGGPCWGWRRGYWWRNRAGWWR